MSLYFVLIFTMSWSLPFTITIFIYLQVEYLAGAKEQPFVSLCPGWEPNWPYLVDRLLRSPGRTVPCFFYPIWQLTWPAWL